MSEETQQDTDNKLLEQLSKSQRLCQELKTSLAASQKEANDSAKQVEKLEKDLLISRQREKQDGGLGGAQYVGPGAVMDQNEKLLFENGILEKQNSDLEEQMATHKQDMMKQVKKETVQMQEVQGELQEVRQFLEELKLEYQQFGDSARVEREILLKMNQVQMKEIKDDFEVKEQRYKTAMHNNYESHMEIVRTLQEQFHQYREVAEELFLQEANKLQTTLADYTRRHDNELQYIIKLNERRFQAMVTAKDAKIMNLIEGTDFQKLLVQHEMELTQLAMRHAQDLRLVKESSDSEAQAQIYQLNKDISRRNMEIEKCQRVIQTWGERQKELMAQMKKQKKQHQMEFETCRQDGALVQAELDGAYRKIQSLVQQKETLRHVTLRLRLQLEGKADDSVEGMIKRLVSESQTMKIDLQKLSSNFQAESLKTESLKNQAKKASMVRRKLEEELTKRATEYTRLTNTFESFLKSKKVEKVSSQPRKALHESNKFGNVFHTKYGEEARQAIDQMHIHVADDNIDSSVLANLSEARLDRYIENGTAGSIEFQLDGTAGIRSTSRGGVEESTRTLASPRQNRSAGSRPSSGGRNSAWANTGHTPRPPVNNKLSATSPQRRGEEWKGDKSVVDASKKHRRHVGTKLHREKEIAEKQWERETISDYYAAKKQRGQNYTDMTARHEEPAKATARVQFKQPKRKKTSPLLDQNVIAEMNFLQDGLNKLEEFRSLSTKFSTAHNSQRRAKEYSQSKKT